MKITLYHAADDTDSGTHSFVWATKQERDAWLTQIILHDLDRGPSDDPDIIKTRSLLSDGKVADAFELWQEELKDPMDTYSLEETQIELPSIVEEMAEGIRCFHEDFRMLRDGEWDGSIEGCNASIEAAEELLNKFESLNGNRNS